MEYGDLEKDSKGNIWIGTEAGLSKLDPKTDKFTNYTVVNGLANNFIYGILIDEEDNLWISTMMGYLDLIKKQINL